MFLIIYDAYDLLTVASMVLCRTAVASMTSHQYHCAKHPDRGALLRLLLQSFCQRLLLGRGRGGRRLLLPLKEETSDPFGPESRCVATCGLKSNGFWIEGVAYTISPKPLRPRQHEMSELTGGKQVAGQLLDALHRDLIAYILHCV